MRHYFTFGQVHVHRVNGQTFDCDCVAVIEAPDPEQAREVMLELFGNRWAFQYTEQPDLAKYFPRGLMWPCRDKPAHS